MKSVIVGHGYYSDDWRIIIDNASHSVDRETASWLYEELGRQLGRDSRIAVLVEEKNNLFNETQRLLRAHAALRGVVTKRRKK